MYAVSIVVLGWCVGRKFFVFCRVPLHLFSAKEASAGAEYRGIRKRHIVTTPFLVEFPLEIDPIICIGIVGTCNCFGRICESRVKGNATENKNFPTYAPAQDHYGDCIHGLIFFVTDS